MSYPDKKTTLALLDEWVAHHDKIDAMMEGIKASIGLDPNGPLFDTVWRLFDSYTNALAAQIGDAGEWLDWYRMENDMGAMGMTAGYEKVCTVNTLKDLYWLIAESRRRDGK
jgi:hypothetical protein